jgi:hypothetical protein
VPDIETADTPITEEARVAEQKGSPEQEESPGAEHADGAATATGQRLPGSGMRSPATMPAPPRRWRWPVAVIFLVVGCVLAPLAVVSTWASAVILDTDRYVATVAPLAANPAVQDAVATILSTRVFKAVDARSTIQDALPARAAFLAVPLENNLQGYTQQAVRSILATPQFQTIWEGANRAAHAVLVRVLTGQQQHGALTVSEGTVTLNLAPVAARVQARLDQAGLTFLDRALAKVNGQVAIFQSDRLAKAQDPVTKARNAVGLLQQLNPWLIVLTLAAMAAAVVIAPRRRPAILWAGLGVALMMLVLGLGLVILRSVYLNALDPNVFPHDAATAVFDTVAQGLRDSMRALFALGLIVAAGAALVGPSRAARQLREEVGHIGEAQATAEWAQSSGAQWVGRHARVLDVVLVAVCAAVLVYWDQPTAGVVIVLGAVVLVGVACIEVLGRAAQTALAH